MTGGGVTPTVPPERDLVVVRAATKIRELRKTAEKKALHPRCARGLVNGNDSRDESTRRCALYVYDVHAK